jgi:hypothetical protein
MFPHMAERQYTFCASWISERENHHDSRDSIRARAEPASGRPLVGLLHPMIR